MGRVEGEKKIHYLVSQTSVAALAKPPCNPLSPVCVVKKWPEFSEVQRLRDSLLVAECRSRQIASGRSGAPLSPPVSAVKVSRVISLVSVCVVVCVCGGGGGLLCLACPAFCDSGVCQILQLFVPRTLQKGNWRMACGGHTPRRRPPGAGGQRIKAPSVRVWGKLCSGSF